MDSGQLVLLTLLFGVAVGAGLAALLHSAAERGERASEAVVQDVPDGVAAVLNSLESAGIVLDRSGSVITATPAATLLGLVVDGALAHAEIAEMVRRSADQHDVVTEEAVVPRGPFGDAMLHLAVRAAPLGLRHTLLLVDDRTETMRLESTRRDFVANVSHELKTPIGAVSLLAEAIDSAADDPEAVRRFAASMSTESRRLAALTQDIIELSRLQDSDPLRDPQVVPLAPLLDRVLEQHRVTAAARHVNVSAVASKRLAVLGDDKLLSVAVANLVANAIQYSPPGSRVGVAARGRDDGTVDITVIDQGIGIEPADLDRVFERFYRVDPARARSTGGTGLGLSIVKHVAGNHGGDVRVWSQPGKGSTFTIRLPLASPAAEIAAAPPGKKRGRA